MTPSCAAWLLLVVGYCASVAAVPRLLLVDSPPAYPLPPAIEDDTPLPNGTALADGEPLVVYDNGLSAGWRDASFGCISCIDQNTDQVRNGSSASFYAQHAAWTAIVWETDLAIPNTAVLDLYVRGDQMTRVSFTLEDSTNRLSTLPLRFAAPSAALAAQGFHVLSQDNDNWLHVQIDIKALAPPSPALSPGFNGSWNRAVFADVSGSGFILQLDSVSFLTPSDASSVPQSTEPPSLVPVLNADGLLTNASTPTMFVMRLAPGSSVGDVLRICANLSATPGGGSCEVTSLPSVHDGSIPASAQVDWPFQTITLSSPSALASLRAGLVGNVAYFEGDLLASIHHTHSISPVAHRSPAPKPSRRPPPAGSRAPPKGSTPPSLGSGPNSTVTTGPQSTSAAASWGLDRLDQVYLPLDGQYNPGSLDGTGAHVYMLDTGVRTTHIDFVGRVGSGTFYVGSSFQDDNGHGTHTAGTAVGAIHGVARGATLHPVKVLDSTGYGTYSNIIAAMGWVLTDAQNNGWADRTVVSMSLSGPTAASLNDAIQTLATNGIPTVVAAGNNNGGDACSYSPSSATASFAVAASTSTDALASYSNIGSCVFTVAPGSNIVSASYTSDTGEAIMSGTSMAAPHVAGVVAMVLQSHPGAVNSLVNTVLSQAADPISFNANLPARLANAQTSRLGGPPAATPAPGTPVVTQAGSPPPPPPPAPVQQQRASPPPPPPPPGQQVGFQPFAPIGRPGGTPGSLPLWCNICPSCIFCTGG